MWMSISIYLYIVAAIVFYIDVYEGEADDGWHWIIPVIFWPISLPFFLIWFAIQDPRD